MRRSGGCNCPQKTFLIGFRHFNHLIDIVDAVRLVRADTYEDAVWLIRSRKEFDDAHRFENLTIEETD